MTMQNTDNKYRIFVVDDEEIIATTLATAVAGTNLIGIATMALQPLEASAEICKPRKPALKKDLKNLLRRIIQCLPLRDSPTVPTLTKQPRQVLG